MKQKSFVFFSRAAMMLLMMLLTTVSTWAQDANQTYNVRYFLGDRQYIVPGGSSVNASTLVSELALGIPSYGITKVTFDSNISSKITCVKQQPQTDWTITATEFFDDDANGIFQLSFEYADNKYKTIYVACYKEITTWAELQHDLKKGGEIKLTRDLTAGSSDDMLTISNNSEITWTTLDLNGHTLDGTALNERNDFDTVLRVDGTLTIKDSGTGGQIIGSGKLINIYGDEFYAGNVVSVYDGHLTLNGGTISGTFGNDVILVSSNNSAAQFDFNGGTITGANETDVIISNSPSIITMTGGTISGSGLKRCAVQVGGNVTMSNVTISASGEKYGGVYVPSGNEFHLSGTPVITGGIYLETGSVINIDAALGETVSIPVRTKAKPTVNSPVTITSGFSGRGTLSNFTSTVASATLAVNAQSGELELRKDHASEWENMQTLINTAAENSGTVTLTENCTANEYDVHLVIPSGKTVTLDLNGYTVDGSALDEDGVIEIGGEPVWNGALVVEGTLILKGTGGGRLVNTGKLFPLSVVGSCTIQSGTISGRVASGEGSSIQMYGGTLENQGRFEVNGSLVMNGGTISGLDADYVVTVGSKGSFTMNNGTITGTNISYSIVYASGSFTMKGGQISGAGANGGLQSMAPGCFHVSGAPVIDGGIYVQETSTGYINVDAALTSGASFSVITSNAASAKGAIVANPGTEYTLTSSDAEKFHSALDNTLVGVLDNGSVKLKKPLTESMITLSAASGTYSGQALTQPTITVTDGEETLTENTDYTVGSWSSDFINAGEYTATISGTGYYYTGSATATFTVNPASVTLTANSRNTDVYDGTEKTVTGFTSSVDGLTFAETVTASGSGTNAGEYDVTFSGVTINDTKDATGNYVITATTNGKLTINPKAVTVTADNKTKICGDVDPELTATVVGTIGSDVIDYLLSRDAGEAVGTYTITVTPGTNANYTLTPVAGTFSITPIILSETTEIAAQIAGKGVQFTRTFTADKASTICLPFSYIPTSSEGKYYTFAGIENNGSKYVATMQEANTAEAPLTANTPYVFMPTATGEVIFSGVATTIPDANDASALTTTSGDGNWSFKGTYSPLTYGTAPFDGYVYGFASTTKTVGDEGEVQAGEFVHAKPGASVPSLRCYLKYKDGQQFTGAGARGMTRADEDLPQTITVRFIGANGEVTAIGTLNTQTGEIVTDGWYTLSGTRLSGKPSKRGIYINNGRKIVIK